MSSSRRARSTRRRELKKHLRSLWALGLTRKCGWCEEPPPPLRGQSKKAYRFRRGRCTHCAGTGLEASE